MSKIDDGGPAFPAMPGDMRQGPCCYWGGITTRDYFAAKAMGGLVGSMTPDTPERIASDAYTIADAMLAARRAEGGRE